MSLGKREDTESGSTRSPSMENCIRGGYGPFVRHCRMDNVVI